MLLFTRAYKHTGTQGLQASLEKTHLHSCTKVIFKSEGAASPLQPPPHVTPSFLQVQRTPAQAQAYQAHKHSTCDDDGHAWGCAEGGG
eukprot:scaffold166688_cov18-Tisochrysis_lutea.AAC.1